MKGLKGQLSNGVRTQEMAFPFAVHKVTTLILIEIAVLCAVLVCKLLIQ